MGNLAAHDHGGATTSASTTPGVTGARSGCTSGGCGQTTASTTPGATGTRASCATGGCGQTTASTTPGAGSACSATTGACSATTGATCPGHTHYVTTGGQSAQHCHCICDAGTHSHNEGGRHGCYDGGDVGAGWRGGYSGNNTCGTDSRHHCAQHTCCTYGGSTHTHAAATNSCGGNHTHSVASHTHTTPSHTHTGAAHTHTTPSHTHTMGSHTHDSAAHTHSTTIVSAGSGTAKEHLPIYFNVKYLIRVI